jgi:hypothetical protein
MENGVKNVFWVYDQVRSAIRNAGFTFDVLTNADVIFQIRGVHVDDC